MGYDLSGADEPEDVFGYDEDTGEAVAFESYDP